jgi:hypothetical protein
MALFYFTFFISLFLGCTCSAQNDLLILKKKGRTVDSFFPGSEMDFSTHARYFEGQVTSIKNDSVFLVQYDIKSIYSPNLGVFVTDTLSEYHFGINYKDIISFEKNKKNFNWNASGAALFGGGVVLTVAGLVTWIFAKPNTRYYARPALVIGAAALAGVGYFLLKSGNKTMLLGKKYSLNYIKMK